MSRKWNIHRGWLGVAVAAHMPDSGAAVSDDGKRFPSDLAKSGAIRKRPTVSHIDLGTVSRICSQLTSRRQARINGALASNT